MTPRKCPEYVGTEEVHSYLFHSGSGSCIFELIMVVINSSWWFLKDSTCIICKQYLYLSAVFCRCRPSAFVCLEV